ncbi:MAG: nucleotidyltransferase family protein [Rhizomicrobium sp.]
MAQTTSLPAEFRLVAACCIWPSSQRREDAIAAAVSAGIDWPKVVQVANRQRVEGLVADGLRCVQHAVPAPIKSTLDARAATIARLSLHQAAESIRLRRLFEAAGIGLMFIKGTALALLAYGNIGIKHSWDIDIVVEGANILPAVALLRTAGYVREFPDESLDDGRFLEWLSFAHECVWRHPTQGLFVELHWRLSRNPRLERVSAVRRVAISDGQAISTLGDEDLFAYLCLHGARHGWSRLKWLADLAAWLTPMPAQEVERLHRAAQSAGVGRASAQALLLCARVLEFPLAPAFAGELRSDRATRWLVAIALHAMGRRRDTSNRGKAGGRSGDTDFALSARIYARRLARGIAVQVDRLDRFQPRKIAASPVHPVSADAHSLLAVAPCRAPCRAVVSALCSGWTAAPDTVRTRTSIRPGKVHRVAKQAFGI